MPNRIIKESVCTSENIDKLTAYQETFFYRLIVNCDDYGRMDARTKILSARLFPLKDVRQSQIEDALRALSSAKLVYLYEVDGKPYLQMTTWDRHQQVRAKKSKYPAPESTDYMDECNCEQLISDDYICPRNPIQSESESNPNPKRFTPPTVEDVRAYCQERNNHVDPERFVNYYESKGWVVGKNSPMKDWKSAVRTWEKNNEQPRKVVAAQDYPQRDYSSVQDDLLEEQRRRIAERLGRGVEDA